MRHFVVLSPPWPFTRTQKWRCNCGRPFFATYMGIGRNGLFAEFHRHQELMRARETPAQ